MLTLREFAQQYALRRAVCAQYAASLEQRARALQNHVGRDDLAACLVEDSVSRFLACLAERYAPVTVRGYRVDLLTLWGAAADEGLVAYPRRRLIRPARVPQQIIECFTLDEGRALLGSAKKLRRRYPNGVRASDYWQAVIRLAWDSGLRRSDCWRFRLAYVSAEGRWRCVQHKTGSVASGSLHGRTVDALRRLGDDPPCRWFRRPEAFCRQFSRLVQASGVRNGTFKWLRRSSGSHVEALAPGMGAKHLGHTNQQTFARHYDAQLAAADRPQPPEL